MISSKYLSGLPNAGRLKTVCKGIAALDIIMVEEVLGGSRELLLPLYRQFHDWILAYDLEQIDRLFTPADQSPRREFTLDGRRFSTIFYKEVERVFTLGFGKKMGRNLNAFNDILRCGFGRHEYGQPIHIK